MSVAALRALALAIVLGMAAGCVSRPPSVVALPNGYYIQRNRADESMIVRRSGPTVLSGPIAAYAVYRNIVAGALGVWTPSAGGYPNATPYEGTPDSRYFVLDTASGTLDAGLEEDAWRKQLKALGAPPSLEITAPILPHAKG